MKLAIRESDFTTTVIQYAQLHGWRVAHFRTVRVQRKNGQAYYETPVQGDGKGWPDLVLVHPKRRLVIYAELKVGKNTLTPEQEEWCGDLQEANQIVRVWKPEDWDSIEATLGGP